MVGRRPSRTTGSDVVRGVVGRALISFAEHSASELIEFEIRKALRRVGRAALGTVNDID